MTIFDKIQTTLYSTLDTATILNECLKTATSKDRAIILKELNRPFSELEKDYIFPRLYYIEDKYNYSLNIHYRKGIDDKHISDYPLIREEATMIWLSRKEIELSKALTLVNALCYETIKIEKFELIADELFDSLVKHKFIDDEKDNVKKPIRELFTSIFIGDIIYEQPKIKWLKDIPYYNLFFHLLDHHGLINLRSKKDAISSKVEKGDFFINALKEDKSFERLSKRINDFDKKLNKYLDNTSQDFQDLKVLEAIIKKIKRIRN